jgi:hypothetical protein
MSACKGKDMTAIARMILGTLILGLLFALLAFGSANKLGQSDEDYLVLVVTVGSQETMYVTVPNEGDAQIAVVPIAGAANESYLKLIPRRIGNRADVDVGVIIGHIDSSVTGCAQIDQMPLSAQQLHSLSLNEVKNFQPSGPTPAYKMALRKAIGENWLEDYQDPSGQPPGPPPGPRCCTCGDLQCCPNPGRCIECDTCGQCCRRR